MTSANGNLKATDYLYARATEATRSMTEDEPVLSPMALINQRDEVRDLCAANCTLIMGTKTIEELEKLIKAPATVFEEPGNPDSEVVPNPEPHQSSSPSLMSASTRSPPSWRRRLPPPKRSARGIAFGWPA